MGDRSRVRVSNTDGSTLLLPVALTAQGQIASASQDLGVTCYNMAMDVIAHQRAPDEAASVFVQFFSSVVQIPLRVRATSEQGTLQTIALEGATAGIVQGGLSPTAAGIVIDATVARANGALHDATFDEVHYLGNPTHIIGRSTCTLQSAARARPALSQT